MEGTSNQAVIYGSADGIGTITLNRPPALNALNAEMVTGLAEAVRAAGADDSARVVVVTGAGDHFMAGGDIKWFKDQIDAEPDKAVIKREFEAFIHPVHEVITAMRAMPKPIVAAVRGACAGFGVSLAAACDLAVAADDAFFTLAYCHIGVSPDGGSTFALPRAVGLKRAFEIALLGDRFDAEAAKAAGLINKVVPAAEFDDAVAKLAARLAAGPSHAYGNTKALLNASLGSSLAEQLDAEAKSFAECAATLDFAEGVTAFVEKRPAKFTGQ
ncbi:MAG: enoyl-CoA hydratase-related protein [Alphaproteobacteria bacterium]|nr:enoyl-CoA hydratase-related protein [Alphaproteobacteria bacterium]